MKLIKDPNKNPEMDKFLGVKNTEKQLKRDYKTPALPWTEEEINFLNDSFKKSTFKAMYKFQKYIILESLGYNKEELEKLK